MNDSGDISILLVEDSPTEANLISLALEDQKINEKLFWANHIDAALTFLDARVNSPKLSLPKLVLLDLHMPGLGGIDLLKIIRANKQLQHLPVVIFSSSSAPEDIENSYANGANSYVQKPTDFDEFAQALNSAVNYWVKINHY